MTGCVAGWRSGVGCVEFKHGVEGMSGRDVWFASVAAMTVMVLMVMQLREMRCGQTDVVGLCVIDIYLPPPKSLTKLNY